MVEIILENMKQDKTKLITQTYKPTKPNLKKYNILFITEIPTHIQFILFAKFINSIELTQPETNNSLISFDSNNIFPYNGIIYSCEITPKNPLYINIKPLDLCSRIIIKKPIFTPLCKSKLNLLTKPITWDKIFVINLPRRPDRKAQMEKFFLSCKIPQSDYEFVEAFDGQNPEILKKYNEKKLANEEYPIVTSGHFACLLSHLKAIELAKSRGYDKVMILEDDVLTSETDLVSKLNSIQVLDYDLLYLGGIMSKKKYFINNWAMSGDTNIMGAYGYILSSTLYDKVLNDLINLDEYIDFYYMKHIQSNYKTIILNDIIKTDLTSSDTSDKSRIMVKRLNYIE